MNPTEGEESDASLTLKEAQKKRLLSVQLKEIHARVDQMIDAYGHPAERDVGETSEEEAAMYNEEDYLQLREEYESRMHQVLQEVEELQHKRADVLRSLFNWVSSHTGSHALQEESLFEKLEADAAALQAKRGADGLLPPSAMVDTDAMVEVWTAQMGASGDHLSEVHGKVVSWMQERLNSLTADNEEFAAREKEYASRLTPAEAEELRGALEALKQTEQQLKRELDFALQQLKEQRARATALEKAAGAGDSEAKKRCMELEAELARVQEVARVRGDSLEEAEEKLRKLEEDKARLEEQMKEMRQARGAQPSSPAKATPSFASLWVGDAGCGSAGRGQRGGGGRGAAAGGS